jgi:hypothetical protein
MRLLDQDHMAMAQPSCSQNTLPLAKGSRIMVMVEMTTISLGMRLWMMVHL